MNILNSLWTFIHDDQLKVATGHISEDVSPTDLGGKWFLTKSAMRNSSKIFFQTIKIKSRGRYA